MQNDKNQPGQSNGEGRTHNASGAENTQQEPASGVRDISEIDKQEGTMNNGRIGGHQEESEEGEGGPTSQT